MSSFSQPSFQERNQAAAKAKQAALKKLKKQPAVSAEILAERKEARLAREKAEAAEREVKREEKLVAIEQLKVERQAEKEAKAAAEEAAKPVERTEAEKKAARDARYAKRKNRKK